MNAILGQLGLNDTFYVHFVLFFLIFVALSNIYFKPFLKLFQERHRKTVEDREAAQKMIAEADAKFEEYRRRIGEERIAARAEMDKVLQEARQRENEILSGARDQAKQMTQQSAESLSRQRAELKKQLESDVENIARTISDQLLSKRA